jgi:predicted extracellular nuclease
MLVAGGIATAAPVSANPASSDLVISEVYGAGGNKGATFNQDFIELYNPTSQTIDLTGYGLAYWSASGGRGGAHQLTGSVAPGGHFLVGEATGTSGEALPTPDATGKLTMAAGAGRVILFHGEEPAAADPAAATVVDFVGFGTSAATFEGSGPTATLSATTSASRTGTDGADSDDNAVDFQVGPANPQAADGSDPVEPPLEPTPVDASIEQIQGSGSVSPLDGKSAKTSGVVTAVYPSGGYFGFFIQQTDGIDPAASDGLFIYQAKSSTWPFPAIGDLVSVVGPVSEYYGLTQMTATTVDVTGQASVSAVAVDYPANEAGREALEGMLIEPTNDFTVTDNYDLNLYGEIGLASGDHPLVQPTEVCADDDSACLDDVKADNAARAVLLDDGASGNYSSEALQDQPLPWLSQSQSVRVGATVTFNKPLVLDYRYDLWRLEPQETVDGPAPELVTFEDTRSANLTPAEVGGNLQIATFNVLNYFNTTGEAYVAADPAARTCSYYTDRDGNPIGDRSCGSNGDSNGPRGAATPASFHRQQAKIVAAINALDADIVALEEIENSIKIGESDRDDALRSLVEALNEAAGSEQWAFAPSPVEALTPAGVAQQDVIRTAFIYRPDSVELVGASDLDLEDSLDPDGVFANAREPLAQAFRPVGGDQANTFAVIANHFKSKGSGGEGDNANDPDVGGYNGDRIRQASALVDFADAFAQAHQLKAVFLTGDFNSYSQEDPLVVLRQAGFVDLESVGEESYSYGGLSGSLDHVLANEVAAQWVTGVDLWDINAAEPIAYQYSRYNYNISQLFDASNPFAASDHNPALIGIKLPANTLPDPSDPSDPGSGDPTPPGGDSSQPAGAGPTVPGVGSSPDSNSTDGASGNPRAATGGYGVDQSPLTGPLGLATAMGLLLGLVGIGLTGAGLVSMGLRRR